MNVSKVIQKDLSKYSRKQTKEESDFVDRYLGTKRKRLSVRSSDRDKVIRKYLPDIKKLPSRDQIETIDELIVSDVFDYLNIAGKLLTKLPGARKNLAFDKIEKWIKATNGWAECDSICQSLFDESEVLSRWAEFEKAVKTFRASDNIQLRRASLVLQVKPNGKSNNPKVRKLALETVEQLKGEKSVLITKAISWLLRAVSNQNREEVKKYLGSNKSSLPAIAYRETIKKIETGKK